MEHRFYTEYRGFRITVYDNWRNPEGHRQHYQINSEPISNEGFTGGHLAEAHAKTEIDSRLDK